MFLARALAMVDRTLHDRLRQVVGAPGELSLRVDQRDFVDAIQRRWPDVAVIDPTLVSDVGALANALGGTRTPAVLYIHLTPRHARAAVELLRVLDAPVITYGHGDEASMLESATRRTGRAARGEVLLAHLAPAIERLPPSVRAGVYAANTHGRHVLSMTELAARCSLHRATLARHFRDAGIRSAHDLLTALRIAQHYDSIASPARPLRAAARDSGFTSARALARACGRIGGLAVTELRAGVPLDRFCTAASRRLCGRPA